MVERIAVGDCININEYIAYAHMFFFSKNLYQEFWSFIPRDGRKPGNQDD
jgi:hypothetical protein